MPLSLNPANNAKTLTAYPSAWTWQMGVDCVTRWGYQAWWRCHQAVDHAGSRSAATCAREFARRNQ